MFQYSITSASKKIILLLSLYLLFTTAIPHTQAENADEGETVTDETTPTEPVQACAASTEQQTARLTALIDKYKATPYNLTSLNAGSLPQLTKPISQLKNNDWVTSNDSERRNYCNTITFLNEYISLATTAQIADCAAQILTTSERQQINDPRCQNLICKQDHANRTYFSDSTEARILRQTGDAPRTCTVEGASPRAECLYGLESEIEKCNLCKAEIERYIQAASRGQNQPDPAITVDGNEVKCTIYRNVQSCQTAFDCSEAGTPQINTPSGRIPFSSEFFDVSSVESGLSTSQSTNFNPNVEGGALVGTINTIANFLARMIATVSLLVFIIGAFILITANGEENQINRGKDAIKLSLFGIIIVMLSYTIVVLIQSIFF